MVENSQIESSIAEIRKRNGKVTNFDKNKISNAIHKALMATNQDDRDLAEELTNGVLDKLVTQGFSSSHPPSVEDIQDMVESTLIEQGHSEIAKAYILYRHEGERRLIEDRLIGKGWTEARAAAERIRRIEGKASNALNRVTGSIAFTAAARASYVVTKDADNPNRRLMLPLIPWPHKPRAAMLHSARVWNVQRG